MTIVYGMLCLFLENKNGNVKIFRKFQPQGQVTGKFQAYLIGEEKRGKSRKGASVPGLSGILWWS